jgi:hypothetical protein
MLTTEEIGEIETEAADRRSHPGRWYSRPPGTQCPPHRDAWRFDAQDSREIECIMRLRLPLLALFVAPVVVCRGQAPPPTSTYFLHAQKEPRNGFSLVPTITLPQSVVVMTPNDDFLALIPQPDTEWVLKRVTGWHTHSPQEQTLKLGQDSFQTPDRYTHADLTVREDGRYVVVRITSQKGGIRPAGRDWMSVVFVIDLTTYTTASRHNTGEPSIAGGQWAFGKDGLLVSIGLASRTTAKTPGSTTVTEAYEASTFELPG